jgi:hypothetical protein
MNEEEKKWLFLFLKGVHKDFDDEKYLENILLPIHHFSKDLTKYEYEKSRFNKNETTKNENETTKNEKNKDSVASMFIKERSFKNKNKDSSSSVATDMMSVNEFIFCLQLEGRSPQLIGAFTDCVLTHRERIFFGQRVSLTSEVEAKFENLATPKKTKTDLMTADQKEKRINSLNKKNAERSGEMGISVKKIPIGELMDGLKKSIVPLVEGMSITVI